MMDFAPRNRAIVAATRRIAPTFEKKEDYSLLADWIFAKECSLSEFNTPLYRQSMIKAPCAYRLIDGTLRIMGEMTDAAVIEVDALTPFSFEDEARLAEDMRTVIRMVWRIADKKDRPMKSDAVWLKGLALPSIQDLECYLRSGSAPPYGEELAGELQPMIDAVIADPDGRAQEALIDVLGLITDNWCLRSELRAPIKKTKTRSKT